MRITFLSLMLIGAAGATQAADLDYDYLRGSDYDAPVVTTIDWSGVYVGGHGGYTAGFFSQRKAAQSVLANYFNQTVVESEFGVSNLMTFPGSHARAASYGAYAGWNMQFDEAVLGLEADYTHSKLNAVSTIQVGRVGTTSVGMYETVDLRGISASQIEDYGTIRARAGYAIGNFLPFVTGGFAVGQVKFSDTALVQDYGFNQGAYASNQALPAGQRVAVTNHGYTAFNPDAPLPGSAIPATARDQTTVTTPAAATRLVANDKVKTVGGIALGFGLEYALTSNILLRAEYQYINFQSFNGHNAELSTIRGGAAVKF